MRTLLIVGAALAALSVAACGKPAETKTESTTVVEPAAPAAETPAPAPAADAATAPAADPAAPPADATTTTTTTTEEKKAP